MTAAQLPPVAPEVTATLVEDLSPRLRKRLDAAVTKLAARPTHRDGDTVTVAVDDDTELRLHAPGGVVATVDAITCGCLLAPACLHRAAAACAAPAADPPSEHVPDAAPEPGSAADPTLEPTPAAPRESAPDPAAQPATTPPDSTFLTATAQATAPTPATSAPAPEEASPAQREAAAGLWSAGAAVLEAGVDGAGAVAQAALLRAAHTARLRQLPRAASAALSVVTLLRAARAGDPSYRTADLVTALAELLGTAHRVGTATGAELAAVRGRARRPYSPDGSLRLYGLFTEPVVTESGHGGARTWVATPDGRLCTVGDVAPGGVGRALGVADRTVRLGDTALTHRELGRAGLAVAGATVSPDGRLGAGKGVKAVTARGAAWTEPPLAALWETPPPEQAARALRSVSRYAEPDGGGSDLLFLDVELLGAVRESGGACLLARCDGGPLVRLTVADDDPALAHRDNLMLLATAPGTRLRIIGRLVPAQHPRLTLLACSHPTGEGTVDLGFDRLRRADLPDPAAPVHAAPPQPGGSGAESPLHLLERRVEQTVPAGRAALGLLGDITAEARRLRHGGLPTAAGLLTALCASAAQRERDLFGRLLPADTDGFATHWLAAARYSAAVAESLCAAAWAPSPGILTESPTDAATTSRLAGTGSRR
ncbi:MULTISPECIES: hypothetical protein [Streptomyces]|uniref:hypothetical protein n=1 Tax=Streptomyces TaxID=1883 RepID=UPI00103C8E83|nr:MULTISPECIES: hypothetical protein [Streptomyces]MBT3078751.1 hypothetical protein [Streptomyces sp. COG21]MBT3081703.1 hypothetical protein [Streptomyces sp. COG20]MBT3085125.1 hypothetical protein [Streptomyces sp. CYG21]MBT3100207.1 hypothetical protein [Streptomyces sp. CBG30]MBT3105632.1 hypothetical protein [Streptomyces sp. COG19]